MTETRKKTKREVQVASRGNAKQNTKTGKSTGKKTGKSANNSSAKNKSKKIGNASASNYPGKIARKIKRTRHRRAKEKGKVVVSFTISSTGGLARISISRSSGSKAVDQAALDHIRRSAPFPAPPQGAKRKYAIPIIIRN